MLGWRAITPAMTPTMIAAAINAPAPWVLPFLSIARAMASAAPARHRKKLVNAAFTTAMRQLEREAALNLAYPET